MSTFVNIAPLCIWCRVSSRQDLDRLLEFTPGDWAQDYTGVWMNYFSLLITVRDVVRSDATTSVGVLLISVRPEGSLTSLDGTSLPCNDSSYLTSGSWGDVVIDAGVAPYSESALLIWFRPPALYVPDDYVIQVSGRATSSSESCFLVCIASYRSCCLVNVRSLPVASLSRT